MLPRIAKIRLGVRRTGQGGGEYPSDVDHFVLTDCPEVAAKYGPSPKSLVVMFAADDIEVNFPTYLEAWKASKKRDADGTQKSAKFCWSDGVTAHRIYVGPKDTQGEAIVQRMPADERPSVGEYFDMPCPYDECPLYEKKDCKRVGRLNVVLPEVSLAGTYQIETSSAFGFGNILDMIDSSPDATGAPRGWALKMTRSMQYPMGHIAWTVPFEVFREATSLNPPEMGGKAIIKHILRLRPIDDDARLRALTVKVPRWMLPGGSLLTLTEAPTADHPEDLFPAGAQQAIPALPAAPAAVVAGVGAPMPPDEDLDALFKQSGLTKAKYEYLKKKEGGDIAKIAAALRAAIAIRSAPAPAPQPPPAPAPPPTPSVQTADSPAPQPSVTTVVQTEQDVDPQEAASQFALDF